jgi:hypothetical protein
VTRTPRTLPVEALELFGEAHRVPEMPPDQFERFAADVKARGVLEPVELLPGTRTIIEGRTRWLAAKAAGLGSIPVTDADLAGMSPTVYMMHKALLRRHLSRDQSAMLAVEIEKQLAGEAKERQREAGRTAGRGRGKKVVAKSPQPNRAPRSRDSAAKIAGVPPRAVSDAKRVTKAAPELAKKVAAGEMKLSAALAEVKGKESPKAKPAAPTKGPAKGAISLPAAGGLLEGERSAARGGPHAFEPCPFCGSAQIVVVNGVLGIASGKTAEYARCAECHACGPRAKSREFEEARANWNKRRAAGKGK